VDNNFAVLKDVYLDMDWNWDGAQLDTKRLGSLSLHLSSTLSFFISFPFSPPLQAPTY